MAAVPPMFRRRAVTLPSVKTTAASAVVLSEDQERAYDGIVRWRASGRPLLTMSGLAGSGKSTLVAKLASDLFGTQVAFCAYTGKASNVLMQKLRAADALSPFHSVGTIHSLIYDPDIDERTGVVLGWKRRPALGQQLIVIDEASMVNDEMLNDLRAYNVPILAVGDHGQLPPVKGEGSLMRSPEICLEKIHRQAEGSPIIRLAHSVRTNGSFPRGFDGGDHVRLINIGEMKERLKSLDGEDVAILTYTNRARRFFNNTVRELRHGRVYTRPVFGDKVMCLRNTERVMFNGMIGTIEAISEQPVENDLWWDCSIVFPDDDLEVMGSVLKAQFGRAKDGTNGTFASWAEIKQETGLSVWDWSQAGMLFDYGYALTVHRAQGSSFKHVFLFYEQQNKMTPDEWSRWLYTGVTRASTYLYIVVDS